MRIFDYIVARTTSEACQLLAAEGSKPVAGCTDLLPQMRRGKLQFDRLVDITRIPALRLIEPRNGAVRLGALASYVDLLESPLLSQFSPALVQAAASVGCLQTRNRGTLGGNLGNASPAGDSLPPLLLHDAQVVVLGPSGERRQSLAEFLVGPGKTTLSPGEWISNVEISPLPERSFSGFYKLGNRQGMAVSVVSLAYSFQLDENRVVRDARIALGAVAPTAIRCPAAERFLLGKTIQPEVAAEAASLAARECQPIDDVRGTAAYRRHAVAVLVRRQLLSAAKLPPH